LLTCPALLGAVVAAGGLAAGAFPAAAGALRGLLGAAVVAGSAGLAADAYKAAVPSLAAVVGPAVVAGAVGFAAEGFPAALSSPVLDTGAVAVTGSVGLEVGAVLAAFLPLPACGVVVSALGPFPAALLPGPVLQGLDEAADFVRVGV
jgi:hypothetical protein